MVIVYDREARNPHSTRTQRMPEMLRPAYRESGQRQNHAGTSSLHRGKEPVLETSGL